MFSLLFIYVFSTHVAIYCNIQYPRRTEQSSIASRYLTFFFHFLYISELVGNSARLQQVLGSAHLEEGIGTGQMYRVIFHIGPPLKS